MATYKFAQEWEYHPYDLYIWRVRDQSIFLLFLSIFLSGNSFLTYYAQDFAQSFNILLKLKPYS